MDYKLILSGISNTKNILINFLKKKNEQQILDPMSTLIRLCLINYYKNGTKISINNNAIHIQEPSLIQGIIRWGNGDKRSDLHNLGAPIEKALEWYSPKDDEEIRFIYEGALKGLKILKKSYTELEGNVSSNLVAHTITYYIVLISNLLNDKKNTLNEIDGEEDLLKSIYRENTGINKLQMLWDKNEIKIVYLSLSQIEEASKKSKKISCYIESIQSILEGKDKMVREIIHRMITTI